ncbi:type 1 glutamine amidotransferase domain-containing protein [Azotosporobacter soli]|uniref:type 1 glutamine amidotransferase domain-containing protein n=1 Tax=Azotosporobacter soli TaxID=3055040 RepID=UPI0031FE5775
MANKKVLLVVTNHDRIDDQHVSGLWLEEFLEPYRALKSAGYEVVVASPKGGKSPLDARSIEDGIAGISEAALLENTLALSEINPLDFDGIFLSGGHGTMFDFPASADLKIALRKLNKEGRGIASVCHGVAGLVGVLNEQGRPIVEGRNITSFTNSEEVAVALDHLVPFMLETRLREQGGLFSKKDNFAVHVVADGNLITGQNPPSSKATVEALIRFIESK